MEFDFKIDPKDIIDEDVGVDFDDRWRRSRETMLQRTRGYDLYTRISHNQSIYEKKRKDVFSEGSTQAIKRKIRAQTIQRIPDGEIKTQFDKNSIEQIETEFIFKNKIIRSEFENKDMLKNIWKSFGEAYDYGFSCVRTGFEKDPLGEIRVSYTNIRWNDIYPAPDCRAIEEADWYIIREWISRSELEALLDDKGKCNDSTYNESVVQYLVERGTGEGVEPASVQHSDRDRGAFPTESIEVRTLYKKGDKSFISFVPSVRAVLREVDNYDPRLDVPVHFLILDPDPEYPLGAPSIMWTLAQQQFADAFQTSAYDTLLMSTQPPLMGFGNLTPSKIKMKPRAFWPMGTNPNNKVEKFPIETTTVTQYGSILENVQSRMLTALNIQDGTIASDAETMSYSKTAQGVAAQRQDRTITVNQYQKRVETFFSEWANHALRSYIGAMGGTQELTVDEETRRRVWDVEMASADPTNPFEQPETIINGNKIKIDFDDLSTDMLEFCVRTGSLIENERELELQHVQEAIVPISQMLGAVSEDNKSSFENILMMLIARLLEMSNIDISAQAGGQINEKLVMGALQSTMETVMGQQSQIDQMSQQLGAMQGGMPEAAPGQAAEAVPQGMPPEAAGAGAEAMPAQGAPAQMPPEAGQMPPEAVAEMPQAASEGMPPEEMAASGPQASGQIPPEMLQQILAGAGGEGMPAEGMPAEGMPPEGMPPEGMPPV